MSLKVVHERSYVEACKRCFADRCIPILADGGGILGLVVGPAIVDLRLSGPEEV